MAAPNPYKPAAYNDPAGGVQSSIGPQAITSYHQRQALIEARKEMFFTQLADVTTMPKNMGKEITKFHYMPLLDDRNLNDQGIDASGATIANGNLYGSSKDIGTIPAKLPALSEFGGRVNRVGFTRILLKGSLEKFGYFQEYTQESLDFDTDADLQGHINREMINAAVQMSEAAVQIDIINAAGVIRYAGDAVSNATISADDLVTFDDLMRLAIQLTNNRTPRSIKMITGSRYIDTRTVSGARAMYCGSELEPTLRAMKDLHGNPAFIPSHMYADAGSLMIGEIGAVGEFRIIIVPEMLKWAGVGADATGDVANHETNGKYDVFPMLVIGADSFTTIGFQTDGKTQKFKVFNKKPGEATADRLDPYGEMGFMSIKWYYGFMILRAERIGLIKTVARL